ncbi:hypothetical protein KSC_007920 [Ktedonobacter sp. SOSP1-52]|nr:hypothetical protein KSC_007920 [Ktedonobacter sp. SOSP1-52]
MPKKQKIKGKAMTRLAGKVALITGGTTATCRKVDLVLRTTLLNASAHRFSGIGLATAKAE